VATLTFRTRVAASPEALRAWHARPGVLTLLTPPWERVEVEREAAPLEPGSQASLRIAVGPLRVRWVSTHEPTPEGFRDVQVKGPFRSWVHEHRFLPDGEGGAWLEDRLDYRLPGGALGSLLAGRAVRRRLARAFRHRHALTAHAVAMATQRQGLPRRIAITGSHGLVGSALASHLAAQGDRVVRLVRGEPQGPDERRWDPHGASLDPFALAGVDAIVHLAGESISRRWTKARRGEIMSSRAEGTRLLAQAAAAAGVRTFVCASAVGWYGDSGEREVDEGDPRGRGYLADVVEAWEGATRPAADAGVRVVSARFGIILSPRGGALPRMLLPARLGAGGPIAGGRQWWSWVDLDDVVGALDHSLSHDDVKGPMLVVSPHPVRNDEFARVLGRVLRRPSFVPLPAFAARLALGEMADELLLSSCRARPAKLLASGYRFAHPDLEGSLRHQLGRPAAGGRDVSGDSNTARRI